MKFNQALIENPKLVDNNTIEGTFKGKTVKVSRRQDGWYMRFCVSIDGTSFHDDQAQPEDRVAFEELSKRAWDADQKARDAKREELRPLIRELFDLKK